MQKWEYCYVYGISAKNPMRTFSPRIAIFSINEPHLIKTELGKNNQDEEVLGVAEAVARLGEEGWEMVSAVYEEHSIASTIFFKRPKESPASFVKRDTKSLIFT